MKLFFYNRSRMKTNFFALTFRDLSPQIGSRGSLLRKPSAFQNEAHNLKTQLMKNCEKHENQLKTGRRVSFRDDSYTKMHRF